MHNQLLAATEQEIEGNLYGKNRENVAKVVDAGMQSAFQGGPKSIAASLKNSKQPLHDCVVGAVNLAIILRKQSRNTMPIEAMVPGATILMLHAMDFAEQLGMLKADKPMLVQATHLLVNTLMHRLGVSPQMLHTAADKVHNLMRDPANVERMKYAAGMTKSPNSPVPTELPPAMGDEMPAKGQA